jgi:hypothetical protein
MSNIKIDTSTFETHVLKLMHLGITIKFYFYPFLHKILLSKKLVAVAVIQC